MSVAGSALPGIEAERVGRWLAEHVDGLAGPLEFGLVSGGRSNLTYRLTDAAGTTYALRRPPTGGVLSTAHDVSREWRFISGHMADDGFAARLLASAENPEPGSAGARIVLAEAARDALREGSL
jgi:aminoglycoside phosphotransferase (APT) family kinase protein